MLKNGLLLLSSLAFVALSFEGGLRLLGFHAAGDMYRVVDEVTEENSFMGGPDGIFHANPDFGHWSDPAIQINQDGYRSPDFRTHPSQALSMMLIGDSYVWGASARPIINSFSDRLRASGLTIYNLGIPGTGPHQYLLLAQKYISALRPDRVIVFIALLNDLQSAPDSAEPLRPLYHVTNAGWILAYDDNGHYMNAHEAYAFWVGNRGFHARVRQLAYGTVIGTLVWNGVRRIYDQLHEPIGRRSLKERAAYTLFAIREIKRITEEAGSTFNLVLIPAEGKNCGRLSTTIDDAERQQLFGSDNLLPVHLDDEADFTPFPDCHLTNAGHSKMAAELSRVLGHAPMAPPSLTSGKIP